MSKLSNRCKSVQWISHIDLSPQRLFAQVCDALCDCCRELRSQGAFRTSEKAKTSCKLSELGGEELPVKGLLGFYFSFERRSPEPQSGIRLFPSVMQPQSLSKLFILCFTEKVDEINKESKLDLCIYTDLGTIPKALMAEG